MDTPSPGPNADVDALGPTTSFPSVLASNAAAGSGTARDAESGLDDAWSPPEKAWWLKVAVILLVVLISIAFAGLVWSMIL